MALQGGGPHPPLKEPLGGPTPFPPVQDGPMPFPPVQDGPMPGGFPHPAYNNALGALTGLEDPYHAVQPPAGPILPTPTPGLGGPGGIGGITLGMGDHPALHAVGQVAPADFPAQPHMNADFWSRLSALRQHVLAAGGDIGVFSGSRSPIRQQQMYEAALQHYGSDSAARKIVAPAGSSWHDPDAGLQYGLGPGAIAADLHGHLAMAHRLAPSYGLEFSKTHPWHVQVAGL